MAHPVGRLFTGFFVFAVLLVVAALIFTLRQPAPAPAPRPNPNGYDDFVKAGKMVASNSWDYAAMSEADLRALVKTNAEALKLAREGLGRQCRVPLDYSATNETHLQNLSVFKRVAYTFQAEGRLAEMENRPGEAAASYLGTVRLGHAISRGGLIIDSLVGVAMEAMGMGRLENLSRNLDAKACRELASALETLESQREPVETTLEREHAWARRTYGFKGQMARWVMYKSVKQSEQKWAGRVKAQETRSRVLLLQLATRAYELEKGERPKRLADLVPVYLKAIPLDPVTGTNMSFPL